MAVTKSDRYIAVLDVNYSTYAESVHRLLQKWLAGQEDDRSNGLGEEKMKIMSKFPSYHSAECISEIDISDATEKLLKLGVREHFRTAASHRMWIKRAYIILTALGVKMSNPTMMEDLVRKHDLSKFTAPEALGYAVMFGKGNGFRRLTDPEEQKEWEASLRSHYLSNPHHPEYFKLSSVTSGCATSMMDVPDGKTYLEESIVDMLACRGERDLKDDAVFSLSKWMDMPKKMFGRFAEKDREWALRKMQEWQDVVLLSVGSGLGRNILQDLSCDVRDAKLIFTA